MCIYTVTGFNKQVMVKSYLIMKLLFIMLANLTHELFYDLLVGIIIYFYLQKTIYIFNLPYIDG